MRSGYRGYIIDFDEHASMYFIEIAAGQFIDFTSLEEAKLFIDHICDYNEDV